MKVINSGLLSFAFGHTIVAGRPELIIFTHFSRLLRQSQSILVFSHAKNHGIFLVSLLALKDQSLKLNYSSYSYSRKLAIWFSLQKSMNVLCHHLLVLICVLIIQEVLNVLVILDIHWIMMKEHVTV